MRTWPWFTTVPAVLLALSPLGLSMFRGAFFASEQLTRNIARPIYLTCVAIAVALAIVEWYVRLRLGRRRDAARPTQPGTES